MIHSADLMSVLHVIGIPNEQVTVFVFQEFVICRKPHKSCFKILEKVRESLLLTGSWRALRSWWHLCLTKEYVNFDCIEVGKCLRLRKRTSKIEGLC